MRVGNRIITLTGMRPALSDGQVNEFYDSCTVRAAGLEGLFEDVEAFRRAIDYVRGEGRATVHARKPKRPLTLLGAHREFERHIDYYFKGEVPKESRYFTASRYRPADKLIEIPDDLPVIEGKSSTYHETLHHVVFSYERIRGKLLADKVNLDAAERLGLPRDKAIRIAELNLHERVVEFLTDRCLEDDPEVRAQHRLQLYFANTGLPSRSHGAFVLGTFSAGAAAFLYLYLSHDSRAGIGIALAPVAGMYVERLASCISHGKLKKKLLEEKWEFPEKI